MKFDNLDYLVTDRVAEITMRRAPVNAIDHGLIEDINRAYRWLGPIPACAPSS